MLAVLISAAALGASAFTAPSTRVCRVSRGAAPPGEDDAWKDAQVLEQKAMLKRRRSSAAKDEYFNDVNQRRAAATKEQVTKWAFQTDMTVDPMIEWKRLRESGEIGDLKTGLGTDGEMREGGIPLPLPSFGVGGEFGVGGQYDGGERFDLRLPYVDRGYEDPEADVMGKMMRFFSGQKDPKEAAAPDADADAAAPPDATDAAAPLDAAPAFRWPWQS
ncbi:hypothetical protein M885DRAFT_624448 [Pelagophyceae sp. CCMP2097]|nr:hypothetical protein M885DRAFT_624448 [Pelagophyceae sp. CCMP2097]